MTKLSEKRKLAVKVEEFDKVIASSKVYFHDVGNKFKKEFKRMIDFIYFYQPKDKSDRITHFVEMSFLYIWIFYTVFKLLGL